MQGPFLGAAEATRMLQAIIDNLRDLVNDINDGLKSQEIIECLMKMAEVVEIPLG